ncbi:MAG: hypothetical protein AN487_23435, partial [Anabaena sp. CRKS33]
RNLLVGAGFSVEPGAERGFAGTQALALVHHQVLTVQILVAVGGWGAGQTGRPVELVEDALHSLHPVRGAVLHLADLIPHDAVERQRLVLADVVGVQRLTEPLEIVVVHQVHVSLAHQRPGALVPGAGDHAEAQVLGVLPLRRLLPPHKPDNADRGDDDDAP